MFLLLCGPVCSGFNWFWFCYPQPGPLPGSEWDRDGSDRGGSSERLQCPTGPGTAGRCLEASGDRARQGGSVPGLCELRPDLAGRFCLVLFGRQNQPQFCLVLVLQVSTQESCLLVPLLVEFKVARVQEASVSVYDYYEPRKVLMVLPESRASTQMWTTKIKAGCSELLLLQSLGVASTFQPEAKMSRFKSRLLAAEIISH